MFVLLAIACMWLLLPSPVSASGYGYKSYSYYPSYSSGYSYSYPSYSYSYPSYNVQTVYQYKEVPVYKDVVRIKEVTIPTYAVVPLYSSFYQPQQYPATAAPVATAPCAGHNGTGMAATAPAATTAPAAPAATTGSHCAEANAKVDKLQAQVELLVRLLGPAAGGVAPPPGAAATPPERAPATTPPPAPPTKPRAPAVKEPDDGEQVKATMQTGINTMYTACVQCHEKQVAATKGNNFTIFDGRNIVLANERAWDKVEYEVREGKMPPKTDVEGKPVPELPAAQRKSIRDFLALRKSQVARAGGAE